MNAFGASTCPTWVILVRRCLFLCTRNLGQNCRCWLICSRACAYAEQRSALQVNTCGYWHHCECSSWIAYLLVVALELNALPQVLLCVCTLNRLRVQVHLACTQAGATSSVKPGTPQHCRWKRTWRPCCAKMSQKPMYVCPPLCSLMVAYLLLAKGQLLRLQRPVTLYSLRQKFCTCVLALKLQW